MSQKITLTFTDKEAKIIKAERDLIKDTIDRFETEKFPKYISNYKQYLGYTLDRLKDIEAWQTNISYPLASAIIDTEFANLFDFNYVFWVQEDKIRDLCSSAFDYNSQGKKALKGALKECLICWEGFTKSWLIQKTEKHTLFMWKKTIEVKTKKPSVDYISIFNVFYDDTHGIEGSKYQVTRIFNTWEYIKERYSTYFTNKWAKLPNAIAHINRVLNSTERNKSRFSTYDYNPVKRINNFSTSLTKSFNNKSPLSTTVAMVGDEINNIDKNNFFLVADKKSYEIVEYSDGNSLTVYIDGNLLYRGEPLIDGNLTTIKGISFNEVPWAASSNGQIDNLAHLQDVLNGIWNGFLDNMKMQLSGMFAIRGNVPWLQKDGKLRFDRFKAIKMSPDSAIERIDLWLQDFSPLNVAQFMEGITEKRAGVNGYLLWGQSKVERVSDSINLIHDQYKSKLTPVIDSVQIMMWRVAKDWILMYLKYWNEKGLTKLGLNITIESDDVLINWISVKDIINDENVSFKFNSLRNIEKEKKRWIIKEIYMQLIQVKQFDGKQINELINVLIDEDFDMETFKGIQIPDKAEGEASNEDPTIETAPQDDANIPQDTTQAQDPQQLLQALWV